MSGDQTSGQHATSPPLGPRKVAATAPVQVSPHRHSIGGGVGLRHRSRNLVPPCPHRIKTMHTRQGRRSELVEPPSRMLLPPPPSSKVKHSHTSRAGAELPHVRLPHASGVRRPVQGTLHHTHTRFTVRLSLTGQDKITNVRRPMRCKGMRLTPRITGCCGKRGASLQLEVLACPQVAHRSQPVEEEKKRGLSGRPPSTDFFDKEGRTWKRRLHSLTNRAVPTMGWRASQANHNGPGGFGSFARTATVRQRGTRRAKDIRGIPSGAWMLANRSPAGFGPARGCHLATSMTW